MPDLIPWGAKEISKLKGDLDRHFKALCEDFGLPQDVLPGGVTVVEADGRWVIACPLPGIEPEDVAVTVTGRVLSIVAATRQGKGGGMVQLTREMTLPFAIASVAAELSDGVLTVSLERQAPPVARNVPVAGR